MPEGLKRYYGRGHLHFVTFSCYRQRPLLGTIRARNVFCRGNGPSARRDGFSVAWLCGDAGARAPSDSLGFVSTYPETRDERTARRDGVQGDPKIETKGFAAVAQAEESGGGEPVAIWIC